jgi:hypothetical protein
MMSKRTRCDLILSETLLDGPPAEGAADVESTERDELSAAFRSLTFQSNV